MEHHGAHWLLHDAVIMLGFALGFVLLFRRLGLGATLGYLIAGVVVGPQVLGLAGDAEEMIGVAELGIALLLFIVGLELSPARLWRMRGEIFGLGLIQVTVCGLAMFATVLALVGYPVAAALAIGLPLGLSSTAQVLPMLQSGGRLRTPFGERAFAILLFQDLSIIPLITIVAVLSGGPAEEGAMPAWQLALVTLLAVAALVAAGRFLLRPLFGLIAGLGEREMFVVAGLATVAAAAYVMSLLGLSTALGAFIAGVMLADSPYRHELEADIEPFRSILLGLFFLAVGMLLDLSAIAERPGFVLGMALLLIAIKTALIGALGLLFGMAWRSALALGLLLSQAGEFGFVLHTQAQLAGLIDRETASVFGAIITLSMIATPFLMVLNRRIRREGESAAKSAETRPGPIGEGANALVVGYGRFGQTVAQTLLAGGIPVTIIDEKVAAIDLADEYGVKVYYGDGTRLDILRQAGAAEAELIMFCISDDKLDPPLLASVAQAFPRATIYARCFDRRSVVRLDGHGAVLVRETFESALRMGLMGLEALGLSQEELDRAEDHYRSRDAERLRAQIDTGDLNAARDRIVTRPRQRSEGG